MRRDVKVRGQSVTLSDAREIGNGGEAVVYNVSDIFPSDPPLAIKVWREASDPFFASAGSSSVENRNKLGAAKRCKTYPEKLKDFPKGLPSRVVTPLDFVSSASSGRILGYLMPLIQNSEPLLMLAKQDYKKQQGITRETVIEIFRDLHQTVSMLHSKEIVVGDFNNRNILVKGNEAYIIDVDSMQFGKYLTPGFTTRYIDPLLCDPTETKPVQVRPHNKDSDWYAYSCMLFEALLGVHPFAGVFRPKNPKDDVPLDSRSLKRISVFHKEVIYPKRAEALSSLPTIALEYFEKIFRDDLRGPFPIQLINALSLHTKGQAVPGHLTLKGATTSQAIKLQELLSLQNGRILEADVQRGAVRYLKHEDGKFMREMSRTLFEGQPTREFRYRLSQDRTIIASGSRLIVFDRNGNIESQLDVDQYRGKRPSVDTNAEHYYWISGGCLYRDDFIAPKLIGNVLKGQTLFWVGQSFGFGLSRAGDFTLAFVFDAERPGINDSVKLPVIKGEILDATCYFSDRRAWFFYTIAEGGKLMNHCVVIKSDGTIVGAYSAEDASSGWLGSIRGKCAAVVKNASNVLVQSLFSLTDEGFCRVDEQLGSHQESVNYPDVANILESGDRLFWNNGKLVVVSPDSIKQITLAS